MLEAEKKMDEETALACVDGFAGLVFSRSAVRLDFRDYKEREYYLQDRNTIRRQTRLLEKAWQEIKWRNKHDLAIALVKASAMAFSGRLSWNVDRSSWHYCAGMYQPTEIRLAGAMVCKSAKKLLAQ